MDYQQTRYALVVGIPVKNKNPGNIDIDQCFTGPARTGLFTLVRSGRQEPYGSVPAFPGLGKQFTPPEGSTGSQEQADATIDRNSGIKG